MPLRITREVESRPEPPAIYFYCDRFSGWLLYVMVIFSPWAFGTTEEWSMWTMNCLGYGLGLLLLIKLIIRHGTNCYTERWDENAGRFARILIRSLAVLTCVILAYCLVAALNARATYHPADWRFEYHKFIEWLPSSFDKKSTWFGFWNYLALAFSFWASRDWLLGKTEKEIAAPDERVALDGRPANGPLSPSPFPASRGEGENTIERVRGRGSGSAGGATRGAGLPIRLQHLLWVLCINGALLALQGLLQRTSGTAQLLWFRETHMNKEAIAQFGPYAYRSNAAQYFNLLWPLALGFWWRSREAAKRRRRKRETYKLLIPCTMLMAICPLISLSRGGAGVAAINILLATLSLMVRRKMGWRGILGGSAVLISTFFLAWYFDQSQLIKRFQIASANQFDGRAGTYEIAKTIIADYPIYGTGPNTFDPIFQLYRISPDEYWPVQLHCDWLETLITFGWVGFSMILLALGLVLCRWFVPGGIKARFGFVGFIWLALGGCLAHAIVDFPLQIYSILFLFLLECAILSCVAKSSF